MIGSEPSRRAQHEEVGPFPISHCGALYESFALSNRDPNDKPLAKVRRGEWARGLYNFVHNPISAEPISRSSNGILAADQVNVFKARPAIAPIQVIGSRLMPGAAETLVFTSGIDEPLGRRS